MIFTTLYITGFIILYGTVFFITNKSVVDIDSKHDFAIGIRVSLVFSIITLCSYYFPRNGFTVESISNVLLGSILSAMNVEWRYWPTFIRIISIIMLIVIYYYSRLKPEILLQYIPGLA